jgi:PKD repeat protein
VALTHGQKFSVVVLISTEDYNWPIPIEYPLADYTSQATASSGESFISWDWSTWTDLTTQIANANVCLKAFTSRLQVRINETGISYNTIQTAYDTANGGESILAQAARFAEDLTFSRGVDVYLLGGYDAAFSDNTGYTTIKSLTINGGPVTIGDVVIK